MLKSIRAKGEAPASDLVALLLDCHARIRAFTELAQRLGQARGLRHDEVREAAARVREYFGRALPLHVRDEEESILPRLRNRDASLDAALAQMHEQHEQHAAPLATLLELCTQLESEPQRHSDLAPQLTAVAANLTQEFRAHLELEEQTIFPALRSQLDAAAQAAIVVELRARRAPR